MHVLVGVTIDTRRHAKARRERENTEWYDVNDTEGMDPKMMTPTMTMFGASDMRDERHERHERHERKGEEGRGRERKGEGKRERKRARRSRSRSSSVAIVGIDRDDPTLRHRSHDGTPDWKRRQGGASIGIFIHTFTVSNLCTSMSSHLRASRRLLTSLRSGFGPFDSGVNSVHGNYSTISGGMHGLLGRMDHDYGRDHHQARCTCGRCRGQGAVGRKSSVGDVARYGSRAGRVGPVGAAVHTANASEEVASKLESEGASEVDTSFIHPTGAPSGGSHEHNYTDSGGSYWLMQPVYDADYLEKVKPATRKPSKLMDWTGYLAVQAMRSGFDLVTGYVRRVVLFVSSWLFRRLCSAFDRVGRRTTFWAHELSLSRRNVTTL